MAAEWAAEQECLSSPGSLFNASTCRYLLKEPARPFARTPKLPDRHMKLS